MKRRIFEALFQHAIYRQKMTFDLLRKQAIIKSHSLILSFPAKTFKTLSFLTEDNLD